MDSANTTKTTKTATKRPRLPEPDAQTREIVRVAELVGKLTTPTHAYGSQDDRGFTASAMASFSGR